MIKIRFRSELVRIFIKTEGISVNEFCKHCGITQEDFDKVMGDIEYNLITIIKMAIHLRLSLCQLFEEVK